MNFPQDFGYGEASVGTNGIATVLGFGKVMTLQHLPGRTRRPIRAASFFGGGSGLAP